MSEKTSTKNRDKLSQLSTEELVEIILTQQEVIEYLKEEVEKLKHIKCDCCQKVTKAEWSLEIIPGQDLGIKLQGLLGWLGNYGHLPYKKQQELSWELGEIKIGVGTLVTTNQRISGAIKKSVTNLSH